MGKGAYFVICHSHLPTLIHVHIGLSESLHWETHLQDSLPHCLFCSRQWKEPCESRVQGLNLNLNLPHNVLTSLDSGLLILKNEQWLRWSLIDVAHLHLGFLSWQY
jgi:hypothetical protein